jgi:hypothetical protein
VGAVVAGAVVLSVVFAISPSLEPSATAKTNIKSAATATAMAYFAHPFIGLLCLYLYARRLPVLNIAISLLR